MIKIFYRTICIFLLPLLLTGCWNYEDIDKRSIELSIGVDRINDKLEFTGEIAKLSKWGGRAKITETYKYWSLGKYFEGARDNFDARVIGEDFPGAVRSVVFSKKYAETESIESYVNRLYYSPEFRNSVLIVVSKEPTSELFNGKIKDDISIGYAIEDTIKTPSENGEALYKTLQQVKSDIEFKDIGYLVPYITKKVNSIEYLGLAAMKASKLIGIVRREDSNGFLFILLKNATVTILIPHPDDKTILISTKNFLKQRKIKTDYKNNRVNIDVDLKLSSKIQYLYELKELSEDDIIELEKRISEEIKKDVMFALELSKKQFRYDIFGFARYFKADNPEEYKKINWEEEYPYINFNVNVKTTITNTNLLDVNAKKEVE